MARIIKPNAPDVNEEFSGVDLESRTDLGKEFVRQFKNAIFTKRSTKIGEFTLDQILHKCKKAREDKQLLGLFELCPNQLRKTPEKFVLNSIWLIYGSTVIRLQRLQTATCKNMLVSILHNILISLECLTSFHKGVFTQSYWEIGRASCRERV